MPDYLRKINGDVDAKTSMEISNAVGKQVKIVALQIEGLRLQSELGLRANAIKWLALPEPQEIIERRRTANTATRQ
jgi:hypothetical protein